VQITDAAGKALTEVTIALSEQEVTDLLVAASEIDDKTSDHALLRDPDGFSLALYLNRDAPPPLVRGLDWWIGPIILFAGILLVSGAFTIARGLLRLLF